jgi:hypothetical protein
LREDSPAGGTGLLESNTAHADMLDAIVVAAFAEHQCDLLIPASSAIRVASP